MEDIRVKKRCLDKIFIVFTIFLIFTFTSFFIVAEEIDKTESIDIAEELDIDKEYGDIEELDDTEESITSISIHAPSSVAVLPLLWMYENDVLDIDIDLRISENHEFLMALIANEMTDLIFTEVNRGARAFNRGVDIKLLNTNIWGNTYLLTYGSKLESWEDLKGKKLSLPLEGGYFDFLTRFLLAKNGVDAEDVNIYYRSFQYAVDIFALGNLDTIVLPESMSTIVLSKVPRTHISFDMQEEWGKVHDGEDRIPYLGLFARGAFARENSELLEEFNYYYKQGVDWVNENPDEAAKMANRNLNMSRNIIRDSLDRVNLNIYPEDESYDVINLFFDEVMEIYPHMIENEIPDDSFYF
ncbi:ABC transporter substrate-binding protein [Natronospora cellulosivora (SeqCode)]